MLSSWLNQKAGEETKTQELNTTPQSSLSSQADAGQARRVSMEGKLPAPPPVVYTTPHDIVLSELHGTLLKSGSDDISSDPALDAAPQAPATEAAQQSSRHSDVLIDPFDGNVLGVLLPQGQGSESRNPSQVNLANNPLDNGATGINANPAGSEVVWSQLSRVLDIQGEISKMHLDIEMIGLNRTKTGSSNWKGKKTQWKRHHKAPPENLGSSSHPAREDMSGVNWPRQRAISTVSTISSSGEPEGDEAGVNFRDDEEEKSRIRGEEFARLSSQFEGRKEAIHDIMVKLDDLSQALGEFHEHPIPNIEFPASRNASSGIASLPAETEFKLGVPSARNSRVSGGSIGRPSSLSLAMPPLQRAKSETAANSTSSSALHRRKNVPTLLVNTLESGRQPHVIESPVSAVSYKPPFDG